MTPRQQLEALADTLPDDIREAFLAAIQDVADNAVLDEVIAAIERGDADAAFRALNMNDVAMRPLTVALEQAFERGGIAKGLTFPRRLNTSNGRAVFRFDVRNARAEKWLREQSGSLVTRITDDTRVIVRDALTIGMEQGRNPRNVALDIVGRVDPSTGRRVGGSIGLTKGQDRWARRAGERLRDLDASYFGMELRDKRFDRTVQAAIDKGEPLSADTINKLVNRYRDNALRFRGEQIGRTEGIQALNRSEWEATKQAVDLGATSESAVEREWDSAGDGRVRPTHKRMNGQRRALDEPFVSPSGDRLMFPGDTSLGADADEVVACRCRVRTVIDWLAGID